MEAGINVKQLLKYIINPALDELSTAFQRDLNTRTARQILVVTAGVESGMGHYVRQLGNGPALNIYQMEKWGEDMVVVDRHNDIRREIFNASHFLELVR